MVIFSREEHPEKAPSAMLVILSGTTMFLRFVHPAKAFDSIEVTALFLYVLGIDISVIVLSITPVIL